LVPQEGFEPPTHALRMPSAHFLERDALIFIEAGWASVIHNYLD